MVYSNMNSFSSFLVVMSYIITVQIHCYTMTHQTSNSNDVCEGVPCGEGGYCQRNSQNTGYECSCVLGYIGKNCETNVCKEQPCGVGGFCYTNIEKTGYECSCSSQYMGKNCETNVCEGDPCGNRSVCTINREKNHFKCTCKSPYTGKDCETASCNPNICFNRGTCKLTQDKSDFECLCPKRYEGRKCEIDLRTPKFISKPENIQFHVGETVEVSVHFSGDPIPVVTWEKSLDANWKADGERIQILSRNYYSTLRIKKVTEKDDGVYGCELTTTTGSAFSFFYLSYNYDPIAAIVGGVVGAVLFAILIVAAIVFIRSKTRDQ